MKKLSITLLTATVIILFQSCNKDDDNGSVEPNNYQAGWTEELINISAKECATEDDLTLDQCTCTTKEAAKLFPLETFYNGLTEAQTQQLFIKVTGNCGSLLGL